MFFAWITGVEIWKMVVIVELRWFWHRIGQYSLKITDVEIYIRTLVKGLHSRTSLWKSGNFGKCFNVTQSCMQFDFSFTTEKSFVNIPTWVCVSFPRNDVGKNPTTLQLVTLKPTHPQGKKQPGPLHLDNLVLCWFWKYNRTSITWNWITCILS